MTKMFRDFLDWKNYIKFYCMGNFTYIVKNIGPYKYLGAQKSRYLVHILELEAELSSIKTFDNYTFGAKRTTAKNQEKNLETFLFRLNDKTYFS